MKPKYPVLSTWTLAAGLGLLSLNTLQAQHGHLNVGALHGAPGVPLFWANGSDFVDRSDYVKTLEWTATGRYAGYYQGGITLTALPATAAHAGPDPDAPALGAYVHFQMTCLEGPAGGAFQFWDSIGAAPAESLAPGETGTNFWVLSENEGESGTDPFGHIHGRRFTASRPGVYKVAFTAFDLSVNGVEGGPIHESSEPLSIWFQAGVNLWEVELDVEEGHVHVHFGALAGYSWQVQFSPVLGGEADWQPVGAPVVGQDTLVELIHDLAPGTRRFYRLMGMPVIP